jgi:hypothetical protein
VVCRIGQQHTRSHFVDALAFDQSFQGQNRCGYVPKLTLQLTNIKIADYARQAVRFA